MDQIEKVTREDHVDNTNDGNGVVRETTRSTSTSAGSKVTAINSIWYIYGIISVLLALRFIMKLASANSANGFVNFIYDIAGIFLLPFSTVFKTSAVQSGAISSVFEPSIIVAVLIYGLIAWGIVKLMSLNETTDAA